MNCFCLQRGEVHLFSYLWRTVIRYCVTRTGMQSQMSSLICLLPETNEQVCHYVAPVRYFIYLLRLHVLLLYCPKTAPHTAINDTVRKKTYC